MSSQAVLTVEQMRAAEQAAMHADTSEWELMQRAGKGAAEWIARVAAGRSVSVLCGPGNNGGDGYVIAELLRQRGNEVSVVAPVAPASETARIARGHFRGNVRQASVPECSVHVDCLFGYGLSREVEGDFARLLEALEASGGYKVAVDVPSSIASDSGAILGPEVSYDLTLALGAWKHVHFSMPAMANMGMKRLVSIGLDLPEDVPHLSLSPRIDIPASDAHKYRRGLLAIVAGEMPGAPLLSSEAAMRSGAGYVKLLSKQSHPDAPAELVVQSEHLPEALDDDRISALLLGPGLGRDDAARSRLESVLDTAIATVLDADALHLLTPELLGRGNPQRIAVTPHEGELAKLCETFAVGGSSKLERALTLHRATGLTVLAKGPDTVLVGQAGSRFFPRGSSWLSVAGTGDVLAGMVASRLASHGDPFKACEEAVWMHHEAASLAGPAFTAGELGQLAGRALERFA